jgi:hypothetical protein
MPTETVLPESELRALVRWRIEAGRLPLMRPDQISAGYGRSNACSVCDLPIEQTKIEYEVQTPDTLRRLIFHFACYVIWQRECSRLMGQPSQSPQEPHETPGPGKPDEPWSRYTAYPFPRFSLVDG